ncbi:MAG: phosphoglucosamine mutase [Gammaproteobacteria bacterium]
MGRKYFGTDGIRGRVGDAHMQADFVLRLGRAAGAVLCPNGGTVLVGKDTRISGYLFEAALEAGFASAGVNVLMLGPVPTPAIAYLTQAQRAAAGVVISASHNPFEDNGMKFFSAHGSKLDDAVEEAIEAELEKPFTTVAPARLGRARRLEDAVGRYVEFCKNTFDETLDLHGMRIVLDCAHGATYKAAPQVFAELGAAVECIGCQPDGMNINRDSGSTHPEALQRAVAASGADLGIAFDGDGDRVMMVAPDGALLNGDQLLFVLAMEAQARGALNGPVVGTVMSNLGLERAFERAGIDFRRAAVGDRYVLQMLKEVDGTVGGESSGHLISLDQTTTGDGIVAALKIVQAAVRAGRSVAELAAPVEMLPQKMINVRASTRIDLESAAIRDAVSGAERKLDGRGRVLLRASGTEPVVRVMVEGEDADEVLRVCETLAAAVESAV